MTPESDPWRKYSKTRLRPGLAHPIGQRDVRLALLNAEVRVDWLSLSDCVELAWRDKRPVRLVSVHRYGDALVRKWGDWPLSYQTTLWVNACPSAVKSDLRAVVLEEALPRALAWLALVAERGNAWGASERKFEALWEHPGTHYVEDRFK